MFRAIALLASFIGASAFAPSGRMTPSSALKMSDFSKGQFGVFLHEHIRSRRA